MVFPLTKTPSGVVYRSPGGVKCNYVSATIYDYYPSQTKYITINMSDFYGWNTITGTTTAYNFTADETVSLPLRNAETDVIIGTITKTADCYPKMLVRDLIEDVLALDTFPSCTKHIVELENDITQTYLDVTPPQDTFIHKGPIRLSLVSAANFGPSTRNTDPDSYTKAFHAQVSGNYYLYPGTATRGIIRIGDDFYPLKIIVNIDVDIDEWYKGKFIDGAYSFYVPLTRIAWSMSIVRNSKKLTEAYATVDSHFKYTGTPFTLTYGSCYQNVDQVILPVSLA